MIPSASVTLLIWAAIECRPINPDFYGRLFRWVVRFLMATQVVLSLVLPQ